MPIKILMPALSPTMTEGNLVKWHKKEGDTVKSGEILAEIETDKATMEVEAVDEGKIAKILVSEGTESVQVNAVIAVLLEEDENPASLDAFLKNIAAAQPQAEQATPKEEWTLDPQKEEPKLEVVSSSQSISSARIFASPLARRIASQENIDLTRVMGTGPHGRVVRADVEDALKGGGAKGGLRLVQTSYAPQPRSGNGLFPNYEEVKLNTMRKVIARRLTESKQNVPHFYLTVDCEIDALLQMRKDLNSMLDEKSRVSVNDFIIRAVALALKAVPEANASYMEDHVRLYKAADVSVAVAIEGGLVTPIIRDAETKPVTVISSEMKDLAARARAGKLKPEEFQGGTFSISNLGMYGVKDFSAVINPPQGCILAVGAGEQRPVVKDGRLEIATIMTCTLSVDHRVVDGAVGAEFLKAFKDYITKSVLLFV